MKMCDVHFNRVAEVEPVSDKKKTLISEGLFWYL